MLRTSERLGWADARTLGMRRSRGEVTVLLDTSIEPTGDFLSPLLAAFEDPGGRHRRRLGRDERRRPPVHRSAGPARSTRSRATASRCDAGPCGRSAASTVDSASTATPTSTSASPIRDAGWRAVRTEPLPLVRHEHRGWTFVSEAERDRLSKRNFYRFLDHWGDRADLLLRANGPMTRAPVARLAVAAASDRLGPAA